MTWTKLTQHSGRGTLWVSDTGITLTATTPTRGTTEQQARVITKLTIHGVIYLIDATPEETLVKLGGKP